MEFEIRAEQAGEVCSLELAGEIDVYTSPHLKERIVEAIDNGCANIIVDLEKVSFIDSSGLGVLVGGLRRAKERSGTIRLVCTRENILKIFRITGLDKVFAIFTDAEEARQF